MDEPERADSPRLEWALYVVAALGLIGLGVWLTTPILNWIVGPAFVVTVVTLGTPAAERLRRRWQR